jgi:hypothetical protein
MNYDELKENFNTQLKEVGEKITTGEQEIAKLKEYQLKLQGGLETLDLLSKEPEEIPAPEIEVMEEDK